MGDFDEIDAMKKMSEVLEQLDEAARGRALRWAASKYGMAKAPEPSITSFSRTSSFDSEGSASSPAFGTFAELFDATQPTTERDKALVAAYWVQICQNADSFASQSLNGELKDLGHGVGNITEALTRLKNDRPALILQIKKSGTSKQARKVYKLTLEGVKRVQTMIGSNTASSEIRLNWEKAMDAEAKQAKLMINLRDGIVQAEGDEQFVRDVYNDFKECVSQPVVISQPPAKQLEDQTKNSPTLNDGAPAVPIRRKAKAGKASGSENARSKTGKYKPAYNSQLNLAGLAEFYDEFAPTNNAEKILLFAVFLRDRLSIVPCSADDIYTCYFTLKSRTSTPTAFVQAFHDTESRTHYIEFVSPQEIKIEIAGDNYFNQKPKSKGAAE